MITIQVDTRETTRWLNDVQRNQIPFATSVALNKTARLAQDGIKDEMERVLDRPKPYTLGGTFVSNSTKHKLTAIVGLKDKAASGPAPATYLAPLVGGTQRGEKAMEHALKAVGALPSGMRAVPAAGAKIDRYGNMSRAQFKEMVGALKSSMRTFKGKGKRLHASGYFVATAGRSQTRHLPPGIYYRIERPGESVIKPVMIFVDRAQYRPTLNIARTVGTVVDKNFKQIFDAALSSALATAR